MTMRFEHAPAEGGVEITRMSGTDRRMEIPDEIDGMPVVSLGEQILAQSPGGSGRTLVIPGTVMRASPETLEGSSGISRIEYRGELEAFCRLKLRSYSDCEVECRENGRDFTFLFIANTPMSFPEFDEAILSMYLGLTPEMAINRLSDPVGLTDANRERYERFVSDRIMPGAEQAVSDGDCPGLTEIIGTGMVSDADLIRLLERSLRSGRIPVTSLLMSEIRRRSLKNQ